MELENVLCKCGSFCMILLLSILAINFIAAIVAIVYLICKCVG